MRTSQTKQTKPERNMLRPNRQAAILSDFYKPLAILSLAILLFGAFTFISSASVFTRNTSAISVSDISGTDSAPVSVSVSNSPLAYYISVSSSHGSSGSPVNLSYTMDGSGNQLGNVVSSSDLVTIDTNSPMSHQLLLSTTSDNTTVKANNLVGDNTQEEGDSLVPNTYIAPTSSTSLSAASSLGSNTWGFALSNSTPGIVSNNFNTETEYTSTDQTTQNTNKYTSVPAKSNEVLVLEDTTASSTTTIYYGVLADRSLPAGDYSNTILYTALAEQPSEIRVIPTTLSRSVSSTPITIYTSISTADEDLGTATVLLKQNGTTKLACYNATPSLADSYLQVTCNAPILPEGTYTVELTLDKYGKVLTGENILTYEGKTSLDTIETMQQMTSTICANAPEGATARLRDARGQGNGGGDKTSTYGVVKAIGDVGDKNSECWMTDNLNLYNITVNANNSDFTSGTYTIPAGVTATSQWNADIYNAPKVEVAHGLGDYADKDNSTGAWGTVYYNWCAATAQTSCTTTATPNTSICPANWQLPVNGDETISKSYSKLLNYYSITTSAQLTSNSILNLTLYYGNWYYGSPTEGGAGEGGQGTRGVLWTGTPVATDAIRAYTMRYHTNSLQLQFPMPKGYGIPIRCVAR